MDALTTSPGSAATAHRATVLAFVDTATLSIVLLSTVTVPGILSIAQPDVFALPKTILTVVFAVFLAALLTIRWLATGMPVRRPGSVLGFALVIFVGWNVAAVWFAIDRNQAILGERLQYQGLATILAYVVFLLAAWATVRGPHRQTALIVSIAVGATLVAAYAVVQRAGLDPIWSTLPHDRVFSTIGQANALAAYLVLTIPLALVLGAGRRWPAQVIVVAAVALMLAALAFTLSRGGYLGLAASALVLIAVSWNRRGILVDRRTAGVAALVGLATLGVILSIPDLRAGAGRVAARALQTADLSESSILNHLDLWTVGVAIAADHPVLGTGQDTYVLLFGEYRDRVLSPGRAAVMSQSRPESPHNVYLATADGAGIPAFAAYLAIVGAVCARALRVARTSVDPRTWIIAAGFLAAIVGHLVTDGFMTAETSGSVLFWTVLGAGAALTWNSQPSAAAGPASGETFTRPWGLDAPRGPP